MARILLIDDDDLVGQALKLHLEAGGHEVALTHHGGEGLRAFEQGRFDLVLTDIFMPEVEGIETIRRLRLISRKVSIIAMTGGPIAPAHARKDAVPDYLRMAHSLGASRTIRKPFSARQLLALVDECLELENTTAATKDRR
ncbi:MAG: response regulator [Pseudomonadota bacterium]